VNPRQRRGLLLIAIAALGLVVVFVLVAGYVADVREEVDPKVSLLALAKPVEENQAITDEMVKTVEMPERWAPPTAMRDPGALVGLVAGTDLDADTLLQEDMLVAPPQLAPGQRELAILVDAETGVAGKIGPDSVVDLIATYPGSDRKSPESRVVVVPITFALTPEQALVVSYAESNATEVRLALLRPGDSGELTGKQKVYSREPDPEPAQ
jgi:pilus assembly protein CpaB